MSDLEGHSVVSYKSRFFVFGGKNSREEYVNDVWMVTVTASDTMMWEKAEVSGEPPKPCAYHGCALWRDRYMIIIGGVSNDVEYERGRVFVLDLEEMMWRDRNAVGDVPSPRCHHTITISPGQDRLYLFGGYPVGAEGETMFSSGAIQHQHRSFFEMYELNLMGAELIWKACPCLEEFPPTLWGHTATIYSSNLIILGGVDVIDNKETPLACVWHCDKAQWRWVEFNVVPHARALHTAASYKGRIFVFGGFGLSNTTKFNDTWAFSKESGQWLEVSTMGNLPSPRSGHASAIVGDYMYVFGGVDAHHRRTHEVFSLHLPTATWSHISSSVKGTFGHPSVPALLDDGTLDPNEITGINRAAALLDRAAAQANLYEALKKQHFEPSVIPIAVDNVVHDQNISPTRLSVHAPTPGRVRALSSFQERVPENVEHVVPFSNENLQGDPRNVSPRRGDRPPPPPPLPQMQLSSFSQVTQATQVENSEPAPPPPLRNRDNILKNEAADIIQKQRLEIDQLRAQLEHRDKETREADNILIPYHSAPPAPRVSLTKETISDLMPRVNLSLIDTPVLNLPPPSSEPNHGLLSKAATRDAIARINSDLTKSVGASPLMFPNLLSTAPTDSTRHTTQRRDLGLSGQASSALPEAGPHTSPKRNQPGVVDIVHYGMYL